MRDDVPFETRLASAFERLGELAPTMDDEPIAREAIAARGSVRRSWLLASLRRGELDQINLGRATLRAAYLLVVLAIVLAAILVAVAAGAFRNDSLRPLSRNGVIAFTVQGNNHDAAGTHLMNADGTGDQPTTAGRCPTYSRDGSVLASLSYDGSADLVVWGAEGQPIHRLRLVDAPPTSVSYALSPDGTRVAWFKPVPSQASASPPPDGSSATIDEGVELWVAPIAGGPGLRILPASSGRKELDDGPLWSPDGGHIAFAGYVANTTTGERRRSALYVVAADGSDLRRLTARPGMLTKGLSWSPDGRFLAYLGQPDGPPSPTPANSRAPVATAADDVFLIGADGTGDRNLTNTPASEDQPEWSPDGAFLAFETSADGQADRLTTIRMNGPTPAGPPLFGPESAWFVWSPDATRLLWLEVVSLGSEAFRSTVRSIDPDFRQSPMTLQAVDGLIVCPPSWQRLAP